jgi:hypothetical protein
MSALIPKARKFDAELLVGGVKKLDHDVPESFTFVHEPRASVVYVQPRRGIKKAGPSPSKGASKITMEGQAVPH